MRFMFFQGRQMRSASHLGRRDLPAVESIGDHPVHLTLSELVGHRI